MTHLLSPKCRLNAEFVNELNETTDVMTQNLAQRLVRLRGYSLAPQAFAKLYFNHTEC